ncbi:hypothetical protein F5B22DRAFT_22873 [Xylaria bambusicola]|uniref:uncharacterized protein n=1 Tax=Xylaria bambusicola TaxID=326684 RepID=UPI002008A6E5|nr:uncharacterized protein F5B22DRAFT_22873 [Xylaria bambusicola]KAI0528131.1 hypothetical protein F5B22DRAFT_22873 [Xylaria bambusicola]
MSPDMDNANQYPVYIGVWTNWSRGKVLGLTLTLRRQEANLLVAFTAFFIAFIATRFWRVLCFAFHRMHAADTSQNAVYHQRQAILRNSSSPEEGIRQLVKLAWTNRDKKGRNPTLFIAFIALLCIIAFTAAGGLSSQVSTAIGTEVLIKSLNCGLLSLENGPSGSDGPTTITQKFFALAPSKAEVIDDAANYAQQCYSNDTAGNLDCSRFAVKRLTSLIDTNAECPVERKMCRSSSNNLRIDSGYIDSREHLGLNLPHRFFARKVLHCAPITTVGYTSEQNTLTGNVTLYHYGKLLAPSGWKDYIFAAKSIESQYEFNLSPDFVVVGGNYGITPLVLQILNGTIAKHSSSFIPNNSLFRDDADLMIVFLSGQGVLHSAPSEDEWYRVSSTSVNVSETNAAAVNSAPIFLPREPASPLGCTVQYQLCYQDVQHCTLLASPADAFSSLAHLVNSTAADDNPNKMGQDSFQYFKSGFTQYQSTDVSDLLQQLGSASLASKKSLTSSIQGPLPPNQWQLDVIRWWDITQAALQAAYLRTAYFNPSDQSLLAYRTNFTSPGFQKLCNNQKIRSAAYTSFSVFGLLFIFVVGVLIVLISYILEPISRLLQRKWGYRTFAHLEWNTNATLQLQRLAHEQLGYGKWSKGTNEIPVTEAGDLLGRLDISNVDHPLLYPPSSTQEEKPSDDDNSEVTHSNPDAEQVPHTPSVSETPSTIVTSSISGSNELQEDNRVAIANAIPAETVILVGDAIQAGNAIPAKNAMPAQSPTSHITQEEGPDSLNT